jgi:hypothetical protein
MIPVAQGAPLRRLLKPTAQAGIFDTIRTVSAETGDLRAIAATFNVPASMYDVNSAVYYDSSYKALFITF